MNSEVYKCLKIYEQQKTFSPKQCYVHKILATHGMLQRKIHTATCSEKDILRKNQEYFDKIVLKVLEKAKCYPSKCDTCPGFKKCLECKNKAFCHEQVQLLNKKIGLEETSK